MHKPKIQKKIWLSIFLPFLFFTLSLYYSFIVFYTNDCGKPICMPDVLINPFDDEYFRIALSIIWALSVLMPIITAVLVNKYIHEEDGILRRYRISRAVGISFIGLIILSGLTPMLLPYVIIIYLPSILICFYNPSKSAGDSKNGKI
jgi:hypothetical protein